MGDDEGGGGEGNALDEGGGELGGMGGAGGAGGPSTQVKPSELLPIAKQSPSVKLVGMPLLMF